MYIYIGLYVRINNVGHLNSQHEGFLSHGGGSKIWIPQIQVDQGSDDYIPRKKVVILNVYVNVKPGKKPVNLMNFPFSSQKIL